MAYDLEEQEQLAALKGWWKDNGTLVLGVITAVLLAIAGWQGWNIWQARQTQEAGALYEALTKALRDSDAKGLRDAAGSLVEKYPGTMYASMGALAAARFYVERADLKSARAQLQWTADKAPSAELRDLARLRLAAVLLDEKSHDEALKLLETKPGAALEAQYAALKGDVLVAKDRKDEARAAYRLALEKTGPRGEALRESVRLRLDALGG
jgi:predicted negative regulator of RcsB-dependent stress response